MYPDVETLVRLNQPLPRYTSYPTAPEWKEMEVAIYEKHLAKLNRAPLSLYIHIPFCKTMCLYCACSVVLNRKDEREENYVEYLLREMALIEERLGYRAPIIQLHFGGGTPTKLTEEQLTRIMKGVRTHFALDPKGEISIEIDPRTVIEDEAHKLKHLHQLGFNRVSFGVQDTNEVVQEAVRRRQSWEMTKTTFWHAKEIGFKEISVDLIYGLPFQTESTFVKTVEDMLSLQPNRIALFSYAKVPHLKPHQKAIKESTLPSTREKLAIYANARRQFIEGGYLAIGMDHFALADDSMAKAFHQKKLQRNFQGYSLQLAQDMIGLGITATGFVKDLYAQNVKTLDAYYTAIDQDQLPILRGLALSEDDIIRKWTIHRLMCDFELSKDRFEKEFHRPFDIYFSHELEALRELENEGLVELDERMIKPTAIGSLFIRNLAATFDIYLKRNKQRLFSKAI